MTAPELAENQMGSMIMKLSQWTMVTLIVILLPVGGRAGEFEDKAKEQYETNSAFPPPSDWTGPTFELSRDYSPTPPPEADWPWMAVDFRTGGQEAEYMKRVLDYCLDGNVAADFRVKDNTVRKWYHAPWMHFGPAGREPIRGLTSERPAPPKFLHNNQSRRVQNWAVGFYNAHGGYVLGQFWQDPANPNSAMPRFPVGTVGFKLLFTNATDIEVPYIAESIEWQAMINETGPAPDFQIGTSRVSAPVPMRLLQIDIAVRDARADVTTGWVFGTFVYNVALKQPGDTPWKRLMPVGMMWGNDPGFTPAPGTVPGEAWLNPAALALLTTSVRKELGYQGRVNGPVDNPASSCLSCHMTAQDKPAPIMFERRNDPRIDPYYGGRSRSDWFRNLKPTDPFKPEEKSLDYSLQLSTGLDHFQTWKQANFGPDLQPLAPRAKSAAVKLSVVNRGNDPDPPQSPSVEPALAVPPQPAEPGGQFPGPPVPQYGWAIILVVVLALVMLAAVLLRRRQSS
jgi:hypothetical protein